MPTPEIHNNWENNRPNGWNNPFALKKRQFGITDPFETRVLLKNAYEAGADAMLEAIWKMAKESPTGVFFFDSNIHQVYAKMVDIPDEKISI